MCDPWISIASLRLMQQTGTRLRGLIELDLRRPRPVSPLPRTRRCRPWELPQ